MKNNIDVQAITKGLQQLADISIASLKSSLESSMRNMDEVNTIVGNMGLGSATAKKTKNDDCGCCPPKEECPPNCLVNISRHAYEGERIIVPFIVKNKCNTPKHYRVGVRELKADNGSLAPSQPVLNKTEVTLDPGGSEMVLMGIDLNNFSAGHTYNVEIVIREKDINQNICFKLFVDGYSNVPVAEPLDEDKYRVHWQGWQSHFYCEPVKTAARQ